MRLTGAVRFRKTWYGKLVLQVQYFYIIDTYGSLRSNNGWRDAKPGDLNRLPDKVEVNRDV